MREVMTKSMARNIFYGGSLFFIVIFLGLSIHSHLYITGTSTDAAGLTTSVAHGKRLWEDNSCINCHTLHGEGAYYAPEVGNVMTRWGVTDDPDAAAEMLGDWFKSQPTGIEGRRQMPRYEFTADEVRAISDFLLWADRMDTQGWPPNDAG